MRRLVLIVGWVFMSGCHQRPTPQEAGMVTLAPNIYAEPSINPAERTQLLQAITQAEQMLRDAFGSVITHPPIYTCLTENCYTRMGGTQGSVAETLDDRILLSPSSLNRYFLAHEWTHAELFARIQPAAWRNVPQWFNEGLAVTISQEPEYTESSWQTLLANHFPLPNADELYALQSLPQWRNAVDYYNQQHQARGIRLAGHPVYVAAGHAVRPWLQQVGSRGLNTLIQRLNAGMPFAVAFNSNR